jgi:hypothetical protein
VVLGSGRLTCPRLERIIGTVAESAVRQGFCGHAGMICHPWPVARRSPSTPRRARLTASPTRPTPPARPGRRGRTPRRRWPRVRCRPCGLDGAVGVSVSRKEDSLPSRKGTNALGDPYDVAGRWGHDGNLASPGQNQPQSPGSAAPMRRRLTMTGGIGRTQSWCGWGSWRVSCSLSL